MFSYKISFEIYDTAEILRFKKELKKLKVDYDVKVKDYKVIYFF